MRTLTKLAFILFLSSCYYDNEEDLYPQNIPCDTSQVTYSMHIEPIISASCATSSCHVPGGAGNGNFQNYEGVKLKVENASFMNRVIVEQNMPPNGDLSACEIELLKVWLRNGAPNN